MGSVELGLKHRLLAMAFGACLGEAQSPATTHLA